MRDGRSMLPLGSVGCPSVTTTEWIGARLPAAAAASIVRSRGSVMAADVPVVPLGTNAKRLLRSNSSMLSAVRALSGVTSFTLSLKT